MRRVVITGVGAITPIGLDVPSTWKALLDGRPGAGKITLFDASASPVQIAAEVKQFDYNRPFGPFNPGPGQTVTQALTKKEERKMGRFIQLSLMSVLEAYGDSGLDAHRSHISPDRMGANIGVGIGGLPEIEEVHIELINKGYRRVTPFLIPQIITNLCAGQASILLNLQGPNLCNTTACSSSAHAIGESFRLIQRGDADIMISGGAESTISPLGIGGFAAMKALSTRNEEPAKSSRPFDRNRDGFLMGEGAATLILEELEHAKKRGAKIYGEIIGYGLSGDAHHVTMPAPEGAGGYRAMKMSLQTAALNPEDIGYINAHGTSTPAGDVEEIRAIAKLFPKHRNHLAVSSTKSMTGHLLGASGAVEALFSLLAIRDSVIPPTINLDEIDPVCLETGIELTPHRPIEKKIRYSLSNSFGFGGTNASLILARFDG